MNNKEFDYFDDIDGLEDISIDDSLYDDLFDNNKIDYKKEIQDIYNDIIKYEQKDKEELFDISNSSNDELIGNSDEINQIERLDDDIKKSKINNKYKSIIFISIIFIVAFIFIIFKSFSNHKNILIKFDTDGGSNISNQFIKYNSKVNIPDEPSKDGYIFDGWYLDNNLFNFNSLVKDNIILKAHWKKEIVELTNIKLEQEEITLLPSDIKKLVLIFEPSDLVSDVIWSSSNDNIVAVNNEGVISAKEVGEAVITVKTIDGKLSTSCIIKVSNNIINVKSMILNKDNFTLNIGEEYQLYPLITPNDASDKGLTWSSSNTSVALVNNGNIKAINSGTTIISAVTNDGNIKDSLILTVIDNKNNNIIKKDDNKKIDYSIKVVNKNITLEEGQTSNIKVNVVPSNDKLVWHSSDKSIVNVENGIIKAIKPGKATITVKGSTGVFDICNVIVNEKIIVNDKYNIIFNLVEDSDTEDIKYSISATKNDSTISDYIVVYDNNNYEPNSIITDINKDIDNAQLIINGELVSAQVIYND